SYSFFFESLFFLTRNGMTIHEIPIVLPARTYGHSKLTAKEALKSGRFLLKLWLESIFHPRFHVSSRVLCTDAQLSDPQNWNDYWADSSGGLLRHTYTLFARTYRRMVIRPYTRYVLTKHFPAGSALLHAGCGSGEVDEDLHEYLHITALDISTEAL